MSALLSVLLGRNGLMLALILGLSVTVFMWDRQRITAAEKRGGAATVAKIEKANGKLVRKARDARRGVSAGGSARRVFERYCVNCGD